MSEIITELKIVSDPTHEAAHHQATLAALEAATTKLDASNERMLGTYTRLATPMSNVSRQWERLEAAVDPATRAYQQWTRAQAQADAAVQRGIVSEEEAIRTLDLYQQKLLGLTDTPPLPNPIPPSLPGTAQLGAAQLQNLSYQFQDLGQAVLTGQPLFRTFIQQGSQMVQVFGAGTGVLAAVKQLGAGLLSFVTNPLNLAVLGFAGLAAGVQAVIGLFGSAKSRTQELEAITDQMADTVARLRDVYGEAEQAVERLNDEERIHRLTVATDGLTVAARDLADQMTILRTLQMEDLADYRLQGVIPPEALQQLQDYIALFRNDSLSIAEFRTAVEGLSLAFNDPALTDFRQQIMSWTEEGAKAEDLVTSLRAQILLLQDPTNEWARAIVGVASTTDEAAAANDELAQRYRDVRDAAAAFYADANAPHLTGLDKTLADISDRAADVRDAINDMLAAGGLTDAQTQTLTGWINRIDEAETSWRSTAIAEDAAARAAQDAAARTQDFNAAMAQLRGIAAPALNEATQAAQQFVTALEEAVTIGQQVAAVEALIAANARMMRSAGEAAADYVAGLQHELDLSRMGDRDRAIQAAIDGLSAEAAAVAGTTDSVRELAGAIYDQNQANAEAARVSTAAAKAADALTDAFDAATKSAQGQIDALRLQIETFGMSAEAAAAFRFEQDLLNAAMADGSATDAEIARIGELTAAYRDRQVQLAALNAGKDAATRRQDLLNDAFSSTLDNVLAVVRGSETALDVLVKVFDQVSSRLANLAKEAAKSALAEGGGFGKAIGFGLLSIFTAVIGRIIEARREARAAREEWEKTAPDFAARLPATMHSLHSGLGSADPMLIAANRVLDIGQELGKLINDTATAIKYLHGGSEALTAVTDAAKAYAVTLIQQPPELSEVEKRFLEIHGAASALRRVLIGLGMSAEDAAKSIDTGVTAALRKLKGDFTLDLARRLNDAVGKGYINDIADLIKQTQQDLADALLLGIDKSKVLDVFRYSAQEIVNGAGLTGAAFDQLIKLFPQLAGVVHSAATSISDSMDKINDVARNIVDYVTGLVSGGESTLSPAAKFENARKLYESQLLLAQGGDITAQQNITKYAEAYRLAARDMFASGLGYQDIFNKITKDLLKLPAVQLADDPVVVELRKVLSGIVGLKDNDTVWYRSLWTAISSGPNAAAVALIPLFNRLDTNLNGLLSFDELKLGLKGIASDDQIRAMIKAIDLNGDGQISQMELLKKATEKVEVKAKGIIDVNVDSPNYLGKTFFGPMLDNLDAISEYTRITAKYANIKHPKLYDLFHGNSAAAGSGSLGASFGAASAFDLGSAIGNDNSAAIAAMGSAIARATVAASMGVVETLRQEVGELRALVDRGNRERRADANRPKPAGTVAA